MSASFSRLMDKDPESNTETWYHYDETTSEATIETRRDVSDLVDHNKRMYNAYDERSRWQDNNLVAQIPDFLWYKLKDKGLHEDPKKMRAWLNDKDNAAFRARPGRV